MTDQPGGHRSVGGGKDIGEHAFGHGAEDSIGTDYPDQQVGNYKENQDREKEVSEVARFKAIPEKLDLGDVAMALGNGPYPDPDQEKTGRVNQAGRRCHEPVGSDTNLERFSGRTDQCEGRHGCPENRHQEHERADRMACYKVVFRSSPE